MAVWPEFYFYTRVILLMLRKTWSGLRHKEAREPTGFQFSVSQLMDQSGFSFGLSGSSRGGGGGGGGGALERDVRASPQAQRTATGWTSSAAGRCSSDTVRSQTARGTQEKEGDISATCFFKKCFFNVQRRQRARGVLWAVWRRSSSRSCSARPLNTASSAPCSRTLPYWAVKQNVQHNVSLLACTGHGEQISTWKAKD